MAALADDRRARPSRPPRRVRPGKTPRPTAGAAGAALDPVMYVPSGPAATLTAAFAKAAGVAAVTETLNGVRERRAASYIGWPPARLAARLRGAGPTSARKLLAGDAAGDPQAQRSDIDNAITVFADEVGGSLPEPWSRTVRAAARSRANEAQAALGAAVVQGLPPRDKVTGWWRLIALVQWLLMLLTAGRPGLDRADLVPPRVAQVVLADQRHLAGALARGHGGRAAAAGLADRVVVPEHGGARGRPRARTGQPGHHVPDRRRHQRTGPGSRPAANSPTTSASAPSWPPPATAAWPLTPTPWPPAATWPSAGPD